MMMMMIMSRSPGNESPNDDKSEGAARRIAHLASNMRIIDQKGSAKVALGPDYIPGNMDVICSRGKSAFNHPGNQRFRGLIEQHKREYAAAASKFQKSVLVSQIVDEVRQASPGGGFVRSENGRWYEVGDSIAREKVGQSFRDALAGRFDSYSKTQKRTGKAKPLLHTTALKGDSVVDEASSGPRTASPQLKAAPEAQISLMTTSDKRPNSLLHTECNAIINNMDPVNMDPIAFHGANFTEPATYSDDINQLCNLPDSHSRNEAFHDIEPISFQEAMSQPSILDLPVYPGERPTNIESNTSIAHGEASEDWSSLLEILQSDGSRNPTPSDMGNSFPRRDERGEL